MAERKQPAVNLPPATEVAIVVRDMESAIEYYCSNFGWGPFKVHDIELNGVMYRGRQVDCRLRNAISMSGALCMELVQPIAGESVFSEFLRDRGEGIHHLGVFVDDLDGMLAKLADAGIHPIFQGSGMGASFAMVESQQTGGVMVEMIEMGKI